MENLKIEYLPIKQLKPYEKNARKHADYDVSQIMVSIEKYGFSDPIGVWGENNIIVEGHGRLMAAKKLKLKEVPVIHLDHLTDEQRKEYALIHNKSAELSEWDLETLLAEINELDLSDFDIDWGIDGLEMPEEEATIVEDEAPEPEKEAKTKPGMIIKLGRHRLMCGDATDPDVLAKLMDGVQADLYLTDPPYNVDYVGKTAESLKIKNDKMDDSHFRQFLVDSFQAAKDNLKGGGAFYIWHADSEGYNFRGACKDVGWQVRECLIWAKNVMVLGRQDYQWQHEPCLYGWSEGGSHAWYSDRKQTTLLKFQKPARNGEHPTMKPVALFDYLIKNSSKKGDVVLDSFGGSGTTIIACEQNGRNGYSLELDPIYCDVIIQRYINLVGSDEDVFVGGDGEWMPWSEYIKAFKEEENGAEA